MVGGELEVVGGIGRARSSRPARRCPWRRDHRPWSTATPALVVAVVVVGAHGSGTVEPGTVVVVVVVVVDEVVEVGSHTTVVVGAAPLSP